MRWPTWAAAVLLPLLLAACDGKPGSAPASRQAATSAHEAGRKVYNFRCYFCHGYSGDARTVAASYLQPPPADFTRADPARLTPQYILQVLRQGKPGTAMQSFSGTLSDDEMTRVAAFVIEEFVRRKAPNTRYHTAENGWPDHERYLAAFPFATGEIPVSGDWDTLTEEQQRGKRLFLGSCVSCHDRGQPDDENIVWEPRALSYPRNNYSHTAPQQLDGMTSASPYALHDIPPQVSGLTAGERRGKALFEQNCAFCHGADGTGKNWIGSFLEPHPRNLQDPQFMVGMTRRLLAQRISEGLPGTSMPTWKQVLAPDEITDIVAYISKAFHPLPE